MTRWINDPIGEFGHLFNRYIDSKSNDDLGDTHNLRRLVMVNTQDIDTWHFKMPDEEKLMQMRYGKSAMDSLLNGTYCLENHFYYHHFREVAEKVVERNLSLVFGEGNDPAQPHDYVSENMLLLDDDALKDRVDIHYLSRADKGGPGAPR